MATPKNASKPQELTDCPCDLGEETANSELCLQTPGVDVKGRNGFFFIMWRHDESLLMLLQEKRETQETGVSFGCCASAATLPGWLQSSFLPIFPMEATDITAGAGSREGNAILMRHHVTRDDSLTVGVHKAITQHKVTAIPWGDTLGGLC